ncbi:hypothetical protein HYU21_03270 [Candidatus Woesearchaeota archaeon]|nr:hypothetical protein [Candidatus Woesearchaeota archaeon]
MIGKLRKKELSIKERKIIKQKVKIMGLGAAVLAWLVLMVSLGQFSILGNAVQTISYAPAGSSLFFEIRNIDGLKDATVYFKDTVKDSKILFIPENLAVSDFIVYNRATVSSDEAGKISQIIYTLKIRESDLTQKGLKAEEVKVYLNDKELKTSLTSRKEGFVYYSATATSFGDLIIGKRKVSSVAGGSVIQSSIVKEAYVSSKVREEVVSTSLPAGVIDATEPPTGKVIEQPVEESPQKVGVFEAIKNFFSGWFN